MGQAAENNLDIKMEEKKLSQRDSFIYLGGAVPWDDRPKTEIRRRIKAGASAWRKVEGVMGDHLV